MNATLPGVQSARIRLEQRFAEGRGMFHKAIDDVRRYSPQDHLIGDPRQLRFRAHDSQIRAEWSNESAVSTLPIHRHALTQLVDKTNMKMHMPYVDTLLAQDPEWLANSLERHYHRSAEKKEYLARVADGKLMGWLSDSFWIADTATLLEQFLVTCQGIGAVPIECRHLETRFMLKMIIPTVFEPIPNELLTFGVQFKTSDFGDGAFELRLFFERLGCKNGQMTDEAYRRSHLGAKLTRDSFSLDTLKKEADLIAAITKDSVKSFLAPEKIEQKLEIIRAADARQIPFLQTLEAFRQRSKLSKADIERIKELAVIDNVELLPPVRMLTDEGHTTANRMANILSLFAREMNEKGASGGVRAMELEEMAGEVTGFVKRKTKKEDLTVLEEEAA